MSRYWIFDHEETPQRFPLRQLIAQICKVVGPKGGQLLLRRSQGYGTQVCQWDELLDQADEIPVSFDQLARLTTETDELFYNLDVRWVTDTVALHFGLHDSTALFVDAPPDLAKQVTASFQQVVERSS